MLRDEWNHVYLIGGEEWISTSEAVKRFKVTKVQLLLAQNRRLVRSIQRVNPYSEKPYSLLSLADLETNLSQIQSFQREGGRVKI